MTESIGFRIPRANFNREFIVLGLALVGGALLTWMLVGSVTIEIIALAAILWCASYWYMATNEWVQLSMDGIQGQSPSGAKVFIPWSASIVLGSRAAFSGIKCISIKDTNQKQALMLPVAISETPEFIEALKMVAPTEHPLLSARDHLKTE